MKYKYQFTLRPLDPSGPRVPDRVNYIFFCADHDTAARKAVEHATEYAEAHQCVVTDIIMKECIKL